MDCRIIRNSVSLHLGQCYFSHQPRRLRGGMDIHVPGGYSSRVSIIRLTRYRGHSPSSQRLYWQLGRTCNTAACHRRCLDSVCWFVSRLVSGECLQYIWRQGKHGLFKVVISSLVCTSSFAPTRLYLEHLWSDIRFHLGSYGLSVNDTLDVAFAKPCCCEVQLDISSLAPLRCHLNSNVCDLISFAFWKAMASPSMKPWM